MKKGQLTRKVKEANQTKSKFWGKGKWDNFIKPMLSGIDRDSFLEVACGGGLFLKMAADEGFEKVIGLEDNKKVFRQAQVFKKRHQGKYQLIPQSIGEDFSLTEFPLMDLALLADTHYYLTFYSLMNLVDQLRTKACYCLVVAAKNRHLLWRAESDIGSVRGYFKDWKEVKMINGVDLSGDPRPRRQMYGILFKSTLEKRPIKNILTAWTEGIKEVDGVKQDPLTQAIEEFYRIVLTERPLKMEETLYYRFLRKYHPERNPTQVMQKAKTLAEDIQKNGLKNPVFITRGEKLVDGINRLFIMKELGYKNIFVRNL